MVWFGAAPDCIDDFVLREHRRCRSAALTRRQGFEPWIQRGALDILPDVKCGGIGELVAVAWRAHDRGLRVIPHGWNTAAWLATDAAAAALPDVDRSST